MTLRPKSALIARHAPATIGLMGHLIADFPSPSQAREWVAIMVNAGAEVIEVQIPFSEPMADGPVLMAANHGALEAGVDVKAALTFVREMTTRFSVPFLLMTYVNIIFKYGFRDFARDAKAAGAAGVIVPDLPLEHGREFDQACSEFNFYNVRVIAPNVSTERLEKICKVSEGMIYAAARAGVTGAKTTVGAEVATFVQRIRAFSDLPVAVGFGIASAADVSHLLGSADLAVIGSQTFRQFQSGGMGAVQDFWNGLLPAEK